MNILVPIICGLLYRFGGQDQVKWIPVNQKLWRTFGIGIFLTYVFGMKYHDPKYMLCILTYWIATSAFPYGEKSWLNFLTEKGKFIVCGLVFGLASFPILGLWAIAQGIISAIAFLIIKIFDEQGKLDAVWVERLRGFLGTILFVLK